LTNVQFELNVDDGEQINKFASTTITVPLDTVKPILTSTTLLINNSPETVFAASSTFNITLQNISGSPSNENIFVQFSRDNGNTWLNANNDGSLTPFTGNQWGSVFSLDSLSGKSWQLTLSRRSETIMVRVADLYGNISANSDTNTASWNQSPKFETLSAGQIGTSTDTHWGKVVITYSVLDPDTDDPQAAKKGFVTPSFEYKIGGSDWTPIPSSALGDGDLNDKIVTSTIYTTHQAFWNPLSTFDIFATSVQVRVIVNDGEDAGNLASSTTLPFVVDAKKPSLGTTTINVAQKVLNLRVNDDSNIEYIVSNNSDLSADGLNALSGQWRFVNSNITSTDLSWTMVTGTASGTYPYVYIGVRDIFGNLITSTLVAPASIPEVSLRDVSDLRLNQFVEYLSWTPYVATSSANFKAYKIYYSTDNNNYQLLATINDLQTNFYRHNIGSNIASGTTYYYKLVVEDTDGDISDYSHSVSDVPDGQGGSDTIPPAISNVSSTADSNWAKITWNTDELATSSVEYWRSGSTSTIDKVISNIFTKNHQVIINNLATNTVYMYRVRSSDIVGNEGISESSGYVFQTQGGPIISDVSTRLVTATSVIITFNTNMPARGAVIYSADVEKLKKQINISSVEGEEVATSSKDLYNHSIELKGGFANSATYYFLVKATSLENNKTSTDDNNGNYYYFRIGRDTKPPIIVNVSAPVVSKNMAIITWQTDELSTSRVWYGTEPDNLQAASNEDFTLTAYHSVLLQGLTPKTRYYYYVVSKDPDGNESRASSTLGYFETSDSDKVIVISTGGGGVVLPPPKDTTPPVISNIKVIDIGAFNAVIEFETNEPSIGYVLYGLDTNYGFVAGSPEFNKKHRIKLTGLFMGKTYNFAIKAQDKDGNASISENQTFQTKYAAESLEDLKTLEDASQFQEKLEGVIESVMPSLVPPVVSVVEISDITENSATVTWKTNVPTYGILAYVADKDFDKAKNNYTAELSAGNTRTREHKVTLTNLAPATIYHIQPKAFVFSGVVGKYNKDVTFITKASKVKPEITRVGNTEVEIRWITEKETSSFVEYKDPRTGKLNRSGDDVKTKSHLVLVKNLTPDTVYTFRAFGYDENNNLVEGDILTAKTKRDVIPPVISNIKIDSALVPGKADRLQTVISWRTDEPANSIVVFEEGSGISEDLSNKVGQEKDYTLDHTVIITSFRPATVYRVRVISVDEAGNITKSPVRTILTPRSAESVVDIISKNFQDAFGFLKKIRR
jgi:hypothetical protein